MKMYFQILLSVIAFTILIYLSFYWAKILLLPNNQLYSLGAVCIKDKCFSVEIAKTEIQRERGLMQRKRLDENSGMLFIFKREKIIPFWMKNTLVPLDIIWINKDHKIVFIKENAQPCKSFICPSIFPNATASYVLEINAGLCRKMNIKVGDEAKIKIDQ